MLKRTPDVQHIVTPLVTEHTLRLVHKSCRVIFLALLFFWCKCVDDAISFFGVAVFLV